EDSDTVVAHILEQGFDSCLQLTGPLVYAHEQRRLTLLRALCAQHGIAHAHAPGTYTIPSGRRAFESVDLALAERPAVIASSDLFALGALRAAASHGIEVPRDLGLLSWDDSLLAEVTSPGITALSRRPFDMGRSAGDLLVRLIEGDLAAGGDTVVAPATLVPRESTAAR